MTAQVTEDLLYKNHRLSMCDEPLALWISKNKEKCNFGTTSSACWRGYVGTWQVIDNHLYLIELSAVSQNGDSLSLSDVFDGQEKVFAHWFNGEVRCPEGKLLNYVHGGYASTYEKDIFLTFEKGVLVSERTKVNGVGESESPEGYGISGFTVMPISGDK